VTYREMTRQEIDSPFAHIGGPIPTLSIIILDGWLNLVPQGTAGEICVGGLGLGRGYLNGPEMTAEKFIPHPFSPNERLYRSGDLARLLPGPSLEYLGRLDSQVKIRGYRIETGEIEHHIKTHPDVKDALVMLRKEKERIFLCAYFVPLDFFNQGKNLAVELKEFLVGKIPDYMLPSFFIPLEVIPLTGNGKINRRALPAPDYTVTGAPGAGYLGPKNPLEKTIMEIWQQVLQLEKVGVEDNFFDLGGNSLDLVTVVQKLKSILNRDIPIVWLFTYPTIRTLARHLESTDQPVTPTPSPVKPEIPGEDSSLSDTIDEGKAFMRGFIEESEEDD